MTDERTDVFNLGIDADGDCSCRVRDLGETDYERPGRTIRGKKSVADKLGRPYKARVHRHVHEQRA